MATVDLLQHWLTFNREVTANRTVQEQLSYKMMVVEGQTLTPSLQFRWDANLIVNGGFESGWDGWTQGTGVAYTSFDTSRKYSGTTSLKHNVAPGADDVAKQSIPTVAGETVAVEMYSYNTSDSNSATGNNKFRIGKGSDNSHLLSVAYYAYNNGVSSGQTSDQWVSRKSSFVVPVGETSVWAVPFTDLTAGNTWLDDVFISPRLTIGSQPIQLRVLAFDAVGNQVADTLIESFVIGSDAKGHTDWLTLGGSPYVVPTGATSVRVKVVVTEDAKVGTIEFERPKLEMAVTPPNSAGAGYGDRWRFVVEQARTGEILTRDLVAQEVQVVRSLSGPSQIEFKIHPNEPSVQMADGSGPIQFKAYGHIIHAIKEDQFGDEIVWASCIVQPSDVDPTTGIMSLRATGFSSYPKGLPWLENWNPIAVDPFEIVERIWTHIQSFPNGNLGVTVYPTVSGTQMLPGFSFNNEEFIQDFFAIFIRESDRQDCGDYINKLARDIPFDFFEESAWNTGRTAIEKKIRLAYPAGGVDQVGLSFRVNENIREATPKQEVETSWFSDISLKGYFPGKEYSVQLANADPDRLRRVMNELDLNINSQERGAAWAKRALTRRQFPRYFESVVIDPYHSNAPFGTFDVGDLIQVQGPMAWVGSLNQKHKITMIAWDETKNLVQLQLLAEGAFNYDPIEYIP